MKRKTAFGILAINILALQSPVSAAVLWCSTKVVSVTVSTSSGLSPNFEGMGTPFLCSISAPFTPNASIGTISPETCKAWYASLTTALATQKNVTLAFDFGAATPPACNAIPNFNWGVPNPFPYWMQFDR